MPENPELADAQPARTEAEPAQRGGTNLDPAAKCPHCGGDVYWAPSAKLNPRHALSFKLSPSPGELLQAKTIGGSLSDIAALLIASGEAFGVNTTVVVSGIKWDDGEITVDLLCLNVEKGVKPPRRKR